MLTVVMVTAFLAGFIQSVTGFGGAMVLMMALPYFVPLKTATALAGFICVPMCIAVAVHYKDCIRPKLVILPTIIYLISSAFFIRLAASIDLEQLKAVFGLMLIGLAIYFNFFASKFKLKPNFSNALFCAGFSGLTGGLFGIGGPLLVLYFLAVTDDKKAYLGTINMVFAITETYSAAIRFCTGILTGNLLPIILCGFLTVVLGSFLGGKIVDRLDGNKIRKLVYLLFAVSGLVTFVKAI